MEARREENGGGEMMMRWKRHRIEEKRNGVKRKNA